MTPSATPRRKGAGSRLRADGAAAKAGAAGRPRRERSARVRRRDERRPATAASPKASYEQLSAREYQVFTLLVEGLRGKDIADRLDLSQKTVSTYRANIMRKLNIHDIAGLVRYAVRKKLIPLR